MLLKKVIFSIKKMELYEIISCVVAVVALVLSGCSIYMSKKSAKEQLKLNFFIEYTKRYQEITIKILSDKQNEICYQRLYIDLCSEEYYLKSRGHLPVEIWELWLDGMRLSVKNASLQNAWRQYGGLYNDEFAAFFSDLIKENA
jgi:hypothetical protein